jgi:TPR repeat protein
MRPYVRPLVVTFSAFVLACLISSAADRATKKDKVPPGKGVLICGDENVRIVSSSESRNSSDIEAFKQASAACLGGDPRKLVALAEFYLLGIGTGKNVSEATRIYAIGADKGDAQCQHLYGLALLEGTGVKKDIAAGIDHIRKAAGQKFPEAEYDLHKIYAEGILTTKDSDESLRWLLLAAEHGHHDARADLAEEILTQKERRRYKSVVTWVRPGAMDGHVRSCGIMGLAFSAGIGVKPDSVEAMAWRLIVLDLDRDADRRSWKVDYLGLGEADQERAEQRAKFLSGRRPYRSPFLPSPEDLATQAKEFSEMKLLAEKGDAKAQYYLAILYDNGRGTKKDGAEAARWCRKSAEQGHAPAQYSWAETLRLGVSVTPDMKEAFVWLMKSAQQGYAKAMHALSVCYQEGVGVQADPKEALKWRRQAAEKGEPLSQCNLGTDYYGENPDIANDALAARWFRKAAEQLHPKGGFCLGLCYLTGRGVPENKTEGLAWMLTSADGLKPELKEALISIFNDCSESEISKAMARSKQLVAECQAKLKAK